MLQIPHFHGRVEFLRRHVHSPRGGIGGVPSMPGEEPREQMTRHVSGRMRSVTSFQTYNYGELSVRLRQLYHFLHGPFEVHDIPD
jgi:hypothetical protein